MNLAIVGVTGNIGNGVLDEAPRRGHTVTTRRVSP
jgi:putative NADH-flavin reductase